MVAIVLGPCLAPSSCASDLHRQLVLLSSALPRALPREQVPPGVICPDRRWDALDPRLTRSLPDASAGDCGLGPPRLFFRQPSTLIFMAPAQAGYGDKWPS